MKTLAKGAVMGFLLWGAAVMPADAAIERTFGSGSLIIPMDGNAYQPSTDGGVYEAYGFIYKLLDRKQTDASGKVVKDALGNPIPDPIPVYWVIDDLKTAIDGVDLTISHNTTDPVAKEYKVSGEIAIPVVGANPAVGKQVKYIGGPFVIDSNYAAAAQTIWKNGFQDVNLHVAKVPFTGKVQREMFGTPPKIALMNDDESRTGNATKIMGAYLQIAGIVNPPTDINGRACDGTPVSGEGCLYDVLTPYEVGGIKNLAGTALGGKSLLFDYSKCPPPFTGCKPTANYRVLWVPHWVGYSDQRKQGEYASFNPLVGTMSSLLPDVDDTVMAVRDFIDIGNSLFAECAGIETFEWSKYGRFISKFDIGHNGGTNNAANIYYNQNALGQPYVQIGAFDFEPQGGHLHNWRPFQTGDRTVAAGPLAMAFSPAPANPKATYLQANTGYDGDVTVFTYDDAGVPAGTTPPPALHAYQGGDAAKRQWHYYVGGHMDGDITNGYVVYLGGHSYVQCGATPVITTGKPDHEMTLTFDSDMTVKPLDLKFEFKVGASTDTLAISSIQASNITTRSTTDGDLEVKLDGASYSADGKTISGIHVINHKVTAQLEITGLTATTNGAGLPRLTDVFDVTENVNVERTPGNTYATDATVPPTKARLRAFQLDKGSATDSTTPGYISGCAAAGSSGAGIRYVLNTVFQLDGVTDREFVRSAPVVFKEFLYQGSFEYPNFDGHFRKFQVDADLGGGKKGLQRVDTFGGNDALSPGDAAPALTKATSYLDNNSNKKIDTGELSGRHIYTCAAAGLESGTVLTSANCGMTEFKFENAVSVQSRMGTGTLAKTQEVISRRYGTRYDTNKEAWEKKENVLGGIEHSTAAVIGPSKLTNETRPLMAYFGALDGMLHAVKAGKKTAAELPEASDAGTELWSYIPSSQLPRLQYFRDPNTISSYPAVDASVAFAEIEDPIGYGTYKTVLLVTMGVGGNSIAALDVTDPTVTPPTLLWERSGVEDDAVTPKAVSMGNGSKVAIGRVTNTSGVREYRAFVTTALKDKKACQDNNGVPLGDGSLCGGIQIYTFDLLTGEQQWRFERVYRSGVNDVPGSLALVDVDQNGDEDYVVAGDMEGNLWLLPTAPDYDRNGSEDVIIRADSTLTDATSTTSSNVIADISPLYAPSRDEAPCTTYPNVPDPCYASGHDQPIGVSPTVVVKDGRVYLAWGTGGSQWASASDYYSVYVLEITGLDPYNLVDGSGALRDATLAYEFTLEQGEKTFGAVTFSQGSLYFGTAFGSVEGLNLKDDIASNNTGNIRGISLTDKASNWKYTAGGKFRGSVYVARGHVYGTTLDGKVVDIGDPSYTEPSALRWFKVRSWREIFNLGSNQ